MQWERCFLKAIAKNLTMQTGMVAVFFTALLGLSIIGRRDPCVTGDLLLRGVHRMLLEETGYPLRWGMPQQGETADLYRLEIRTEEPVEGELVLGRIPRFPAVSFWNPVQDISRSELRQIMSGELTDWSEVGGEKRRIVLFSGTGMELGKMVAREPGGVALLYWPQLIPSARMLSVDGIDGFQAPVTGDFSDHGWVVLSPVKPLAWWEDLGWHLRNTRLLRRIRSKFSKERWLYGKEQLTLAAVGDILLDRGVARTVAKQGGNYGYLFARTTHILSRADLTLGNLEGPLSLRGRQINMFRGEPVAAGALREAGFDLLALANNHILDYGPVALNDTVEILKKHGLTPLGAGKNRLEAGHPHYQKINGIKSAFLAYTEVRSGFTYTRTGLQWRAGVNRAGVNQADPEMMRRDVTRARRWADVVVVHIHWGHEYQDRPNPFQYRVGRELIEAGADLVIGDHPHVIQGVKFCANGVVAFSLGNFVFDQKNWDRREGLILRALFDRDGLRQIRFFPVRILGEQPRILKENDARLVLKRLAYISKMLNEPEVN